MVNFIKHEHIFGTFWYTKKTLTRTVAFTRLYIMLLVEAVVMGLILHDANTGNELWDDFLYEEIEDSKIHIMATCILTAVILGLVYHTIITFLFR